MNTPLLRAIINRSSSILYILITLSLIVFIHLVIHDEDVKLAADIIIVALGVLLGWQQETREAQLSTFSKMLNRLGTLQEELARESRQNRRAVQQIDALVPRLVEAVEEELPERVERSVDSALDKGLGIWLANARNDIEVSAVQWPPEFQGSSNLVRELTHALNTPLSRIEATIIGMEAAISNQNRQVDPDTLSNGLRSVQISVNNCKSVLAAYREVILSMRSPTVWSPESVSQAISDWSELYGKAIRMHLNYLIDLPKSFEGYSNNYIVSLLIPVIENAIDASPPRSTIEIVARNEENSYLICVTNLADKPYLSQSIYNHGYTTKDGHEGTGLFMVSHLLSAFSGTSITHRIEGNIVTFMIVLPRR